MSVWQPIETCHMGWGAVLLYSPQLDNDPGYSGHPIIISNRDYVACGNAKNHGFTHWIPLPALPQDRALPIPDMEGEV